MQEVAAQRCELVDAATVAGYLGCARSCVYENADWLGARRLGRGPKARLRFSLAEVDDCLLERATCFPSRGAESQSVRVATPIRRRRRALLVLAEVLRSQGGTGVGTR